MSAEIVELPRPADDMIVRVTGLPLIDADPAVIARWLKDESWTERAQFFSSIYSDSFNHLMEMVGLHRNRRRPEDGYRVGDAQDA